MRKFIFHDPDGSVRDVGNPLLEGFGITEALATFIATSLSSVGVGAATAGTLGTIGAGALEGGVVGAITDPKNPLKGAEAGLISGGVASGISPLIGSSLGIGTTAADIAGGAIGGIAGQAATGGNIGTGALTGGVGGALTSALAPSAPGSPSAPPTGGPAGSAAATAAPASVPSAAPSPAEGLSDLAVPGVATPSVGTAGPGSGQFSLSSGLSPSPSAGGAGSVPLNPSSGISSAISPTAAAPTPPTPPAATAPVSGSASNQISPPSSGSGVGSFLKNNAWLLPAGALGISALESQKKLPGEAQINTAAGNLSRQAGQLQNYFTSGTLPPGLQAGIDRATASAKAAIRSKYASLGNTGSSAEAQDLAGVDSVAITQGSQIALSLLQQGVSEQGMADQLYQQIMSNALQQDQELGSALGAFSAALVPAAVRAG